MGRPRFPMFRRLVAAGVSAAAIAIVGVTVVAQGQTRAQTQASHRCAASATEQARKLLAFHVGSDSRIEIEREVKRLAALRNPANRRQLFDVLEVWGTVYKAQYRMRFIYARLPDECVLMGQEILENSSL